MIDTLISGPTALADFMRDTNKYRPSWLRRLSGVTKGKVFIGADPMGEKLGSGGGTVNLLYQGWKEWAGLSEGTLPEWLGQSRKLVLHAGGESRRLPAYAAIGKAFMPLPAVPGLSPGIQNQILADFQLPAYAETLIEAGEKAAVMVTAGDVWLDFDPTEITEMRSDIVGIGMQVAPEIAQHFGVFFARKDSRLRSGGERTIAFFLQKPSPAEIRKQAQHCDFFVDTGMWLLSNASVEFLFQRCGWDREKGRFKTRSGRAEFMDLYTEMGSALGTEAIPAGKLESHQFRKLTSSVIPLESARFFHLGSSRQLLESFEQLQQKSLTPRKIFRVASSGSCEVAPRAQAWIEGCELTRPLILDGFNLVTGLPRGSSVRHLEEECCLDTPPAENLMYVLRPYKLDDALRGSPDKGGMICGQPAAAWLTARGLEEEKGDLFELSIYPLLPSEEITQEAVDWFFTDHPGGAMTEKLRERKRYSAKEISSSVNLDRYFRQRRDGYIQTLKDAFSKNNDCAPFDLWQQDFGEIAEFCRAEAPALGRWILARRKQILAGQPRAEEQSRFLMLLSQLTQGRTRERWKQAGFSRLQSTIVSSNQLPPANPLKVLKEDQIVWSRSPVRLDLGGGWTDTPPYCLEAGGAVLNVAVLLNGQPPIQVFIRPTQEPQLCLRSIDLGSTDSVSSFAELADFRHPRGSFSLPKAALALAGFLPEFYAGKPFRTLQEQLLAFGGGMEISLLSAVPKGSGLGTSSILGATLLGALNRACGLGWDNIDLYNRVLGVEQLLTTGGGWQDQAGALFPGVKLVQTSPGSDQTPSVRFLPESLWGTSAVNQLYLLYYTGATRMAKGILQEIVVDMFLHRAGTLRTLATIRANSWKLYHTFQLGDRAGLHRGIARSWRLNRQLDEGTSTPEIERIIALCGDGLIACKLLGAGGGGYILLCAKTPADGQKIRERLELNPPNARARFIDFSISPVGLQVSVS